MAQSLDAIERVRPYTKCTVNRLLSMARALKTVDAEKVFGDIVEVGVWRGGNIMLARILSPDRTCWLYDTFDGMTEPDPVLDAKNNGELAIDRYRLKQAGGTKWDAVSLEEVRDNFLAACIGFDKLHFVAGPAEVTLDQVPSPERVAILRLDVDWYWPTKKALEKLYARISVNGFLIVDDYGHWAGCRLAVDQYFDRSAPRHEDVDYSCRIFRKR